jgi:hypothetical protein
VRSTSPAARLDPSPQGVDPLAALLQALARRAESPRAAAWAKALLSRGEAASGRGAGRAVVRDNEQRNHR